MKKQSLFFLILLVLIGGWFCLFRQPLIVSYGSLSDERTFLGIPHFLNVISNLFFLVAALLGGFFVWKDPRLFQTGWEKGLGYLFFIGLFLTAAGSTYFHWAPDRMGLLVDRLAIALTFSSFFGFLLMQRVHQKTGIILAPLLIAYALFSAIYWYITNDIRPYIVTQAIPLISIILITAMFRTKIFKDYYLLIAFVLYIAALGLDLNDAKVFEFTKETLSGHTLKHLFGATASFFLLLYLVDRRKRS